MSRLPPAPRRPEHYYDWLAEPPEPSTTKTYRTREVLRVVQIHRVTLQEWLRKGVIPRPQQTRIHRVPLRESGIPQPQRKRNGPRFNVWTDREIEAVMLYKREHYRKGRGRKKKQNQIEAVSF